MSVASYALSLESKKRTNRAGLRVSQVLASSPDGRQLFQTGPSELSPASDNINRRKQADFNCWPAGSVKTDSSSGTMFGLS